MKYPVRNATALLTLMFLFGCGQTGPLYMPPPEAPAQPPAAESPPPAEAAP